MRRCGQTRQRTAAVQNLAAARGAPEDATASWSAAVLCRVSPLFVRTFNPFLACILLNLTCLLMAAIGAEESVRKDPVVVNDKIEGVIKGALKYLASKQSPNGAWAASPEEMQHPIAITGYTLMAFQAAGQLPGEGEYGKNVSAGMQYLLDSTWADGLM